MAMDTQLPERPEAVAEPIDPGLRQFCKTWEGEVGVEREVAAGDLVALCEEWVLLWDVLGPKDPGRSRDSTLGKLLARKAGYRIGPYRIMRSPHKHRRRYFLRRDDADDG